MQNIHPVIADAAPHRVAANHRVAAPKQGAIISIAADVPATIKPVHGMAGNIPLIWRRHILNHEQGCAYAQNAVQLGKGSTGYIVGQVVQHAQHQRGIELAGANGSCSPTLAR